MIDKSYLGMWGDPDRYSRGLHVIMADRQLKKALKKKTIVLREIGNAKAIVTHKAKRKWFLISGGWGNNNGYTAMMGAIYGDVVASAFRERRKGAPDPKKLIRGRLKFSRCTVMTCAIAKALQKDLCTDSTDSERTIRISIGTFLHRYLDQRGSVKRWLCSLFRRRENFRLSGSVAFVSYAGWVATSIEEAERLGKLVAAALQTEESHELLETARVIAGGIFLLRKHQEKQAVRQYFDAYLSQSASMVSPTARETQAAIRAFLSGKNFVDVIARALSDGRERCVCAAIAGSFAEVIYPINQELRGRVIECVDSSLLDTVAECVDFFEERLCEKS